MQPLRAPCGCSRSGMLALAALVALLPAPASGRPRLVWQESLQSRRGWQSPLSEPVRRAAQTAVSYFNYQQGSPSALRAPGLVRKAFDKLVPGVGRKYFLHFRTRDLFTGEDRGICHSSVLYLNAKPKPTVEITCSHVDDRSERLIKDAALYWKLKGAKEPDPELLRVLGVYGSSLIAWEMSTENLAYNLTQIKKVKPWVRGDDEPEFDYTVLLEDTWGESSISCHMRVIWNPFLPSQVKYDCSPEDDSSESADGSGGELGSTNEFFLEVEHNF